MTLWIILTAMLAIVAVWAAMPFLQRSGEPESTAEVGGEAARSSAVYRDQLRQIDAELRAGVIDEAEALTTRAEVARRLILAERDESTAQKPTSMGDRTFLAIGIAGAIALGSSIIYAKIGEPDRLPSARSAGDGGADGMGGLPPRHPPIAGNTAPPRMQPSASSRPDGQGSALPGVDGMIERLAQRLRGNPDDPDGWRVLGWSYASQGRLKDAAAAYDEAIKRQPGNGDLYSARGEIEVHSGNGVVSSGAVALFDEALKRDKDNPRARFFLGLRKEQSGDRAAALEDWIAILKTAPATEAWARSLEQRVEQLASELKVDLRERRPLLAPASQTAGSDPAHPGFPRQATRPGAQADLAATDGGQRTASPSPEEESNMIRGMVDGLATRLEAQPRDLNGWTRLIRSRVVLGEIDKARAALAKAREIFADTPAALGTIAASAREIGLEP